MVTLTIFGNDVNGIGRRRLLSDLLSRINRSVKRSSSTFNPALAKSEENALIGLNEMSRSGIPSEGIQLQKMKPVDRESLQQQSYHALREALMKGRFMPGDTVSLRNLAQELGTSPMPVREAVQHLIAEGALVLRPNRTYAVPDMTREILAELQTLRVILEGSVVEAAGPLIDAQALAKLYELQGQMRSALAVGDSKRYLVKNQDFHFTLYRSSGMAIAINIIETLWLRIGPSFNLLTSGERAAARDEKQIASLTDHHEAALAAIVARSPSGLRNAIERDIIEGMEFLIQCTPA